MTQITIAMLEWLDACSSQIELFEATFGESAELTPENGEKAVVAGLDIDWLANKVLTGERLAEYERVVAPALAKYQRVVAPAWAEYQRVEATARAEYQRVKAPALAEYQRVADATWAEYERVMAPAWAEYQRVAAATFVRVAGMEAGE